MLISIKWTTLHALDDGDSEGAIVAAGASSLPPDHVQSFESSHVSNGNDLDGESAHRAGDDVSGVTRLLLRGMGIGTSSPRSLRW